MITELRAPKHLILSDSVCLQMQNFICWQLSFSSGFKSDSTLWNEERPKEPFIHVMCSSVQLELHFNWRIHHVTKRQIKLTKWFMKIFIKIWFSGFSPLGHPDCTSIKPSSRGSHRKWSASFLKWKVENRITKKDYIALPAHMTPATENRRSLGTDEAGMVRRSTAKSASLVEQRHPTLVQYSMGSSGLWSFLAWSWLRASMESFLRRSRSVANLWNNQIKCAELQKIKQTLFQTLLPCSVSVSHDGWACPGGRHQGCRLPPPASPQPLVRPHSPRQPGWRSRASWSPPSGILAPASFLRRSGRWTAEERGML